MTSKGYHHTKEAKERIRLAHIGRVYSVGMRRKCSIEANKRLENPEWRQHMRVLVLNAWEKPNAKERHSLAMKKVWNRKGYRENMSVKLKSLWETEEFRSKTLKNGVGANKGKKLSPITREKVRIARLKQIFPKKQTKIEIIIQELLDNLHVKYVRNFPIENICQADQVIPESKIAIFEDGCYWHGCEKCGHTKYRFRQLFDDKNSIALRVRGWHVLRFWEHDIKTRPEHILKVIKNVI